MWPVYKAAGRIAAIGIDKICKAAEAKGRKLLARKKRPKARPARKRKVK